MKKQEKSFFVDNLASGIRDAKSVVLVEFSGLPVKLQQKLRKALEQEGATITIGKNTLIQRAIGLSDYKIDPENLRQVFKGQTAVVLASGDEISPLQIISRFGQEYGFLNFKAGIISEKFCDRDTLVKLSQFPRVSVLEARLISQLASPLYSIPLILEANMRSFISILEQTAKK